jgi:hypothetical protein
MKSRAALGQLAIAGLAAALSITSAGPSVAAQRDLDLLQSYVGDWRGTGSMNTASGEETVRCKLDVKRASAEKVNYNGRCTLAGGNLSINGTLAYISERNRYEAIMSSNTTFSGQAIGRRSGSGINFNLEERDPDTGSTIKVNVGLALRSEKIEVDFKLTDTASGNSTRAKVPFSK